MVMVTMMSVRILVCSLLIVRGLSTQPDELYCQTLEDGETVQCTYRDDTADDVVTDVSPQQGNGDARDARDEPKQRTERTTINQQTQPELSNNNQDIHVGSITYHHPFNNYPTPVQNILRQYNLQQDDANWYYELGLAHARDQDGTADKNTGPQYAMNAYQQAIQLYQGVRQSSSTTPVQYNHAGHYLANLYVDMSAAYGNDDKVNSLLYIQQAEDLYRSLRASTTLIASELKLVDLGWAHACVRLGVLLIEHELESISAKAVEENATQHSSRKGHDFFQQAIQVYSTILENEQNPTEVIIVKRDLANALQNSATAAAALGMNSIEHYTQALDLYKSIFHHLTTPREQENVAISMGDLLFSLSYSYLQAGQFDKSVEHYRATMDWYEEHDISPPRSEPMGSFGEDTIDLYQNALDEYNELMNGSAHIDISDGASAFDEETGTSVFERNDGYEADIHASLGAFYMASDDLIQAQAHIAQSILLYKKSTEEDEEYLAEAHFNMALLEFTIRDFRNSLASFESAVSLFRKVFGEGNNPLDRGSFGAKMDPSDLNNYDSTTDKRTGGEKDASINDPSNGQQRVEPAQTVKAHHTKGSPVFPKFNLQDFRYSLAQNETKNEDVRHVDSKMDEHINDDMENDEL